MVCMNTDRTEDQRWTAFIYDCDNRWCKIFKPVEILHWYALNILYVEFQSEKNKLEQEVKECKISAWPKFWIFVFSVVVKIFLPFRFAWHSLGWLKKWKKRLNNLVLNSQTSSLKVCCLQCSLSLTCRSLNEKLKKQKYHYFTTFFPPLLKQLCCSI